MIFTHLFCGRCMLLIKKTYVDIGQLLKLSLQLSFVLNQLINALKDRGLNLKNRSLDVIKYIKMTSAYIHMCTWISSQLFYNRTHKLSFSYS